jgi:hypothetical protein
MEKCSISTCEKEAQVFCRDGCYCRECFKNWIRRKEVEFRRKKEKN